MDINVTITKNPIPEIFKLVKPGVKTRQLFRYIGAELSRDAKDGARAHGGRKFWGQIANSVRRETSETGVIVGSTHYAASHKQYGGTISAPGKGPMSRNSKYLTIPIDDEARGKNASDFKNTFIQKSKAGNLIIFKSLGQPGIKPLFVLKKSVDQRAFPWFPEGEQANRDIRKGAGRYFKKQIGG